MFRSLVLLFKMRTTSLAIASLAILFSGECFSQTFGDWGAGTAEDGTPNIFTMNNSDALFGKYCDAESQKCFWLIASPEVTCEPGHEAAALVSSDLGTFSVTLDCAGPTKLQTKTYWRWTLSNPDDFDSVAEKSNTLGIAVAMENGNFRVFRFPMSGSERALAHFRQRLSAYSQVRQTPKRNTKDSVL
jgi:hypothetical protein